MNGRTNAKNGAGAIRDGCAVLEVKAPAQSQITAIRADGLTKKQSKGYVDLSDSDYWFYYIIIQKFELSNLEWTVTATKGTDTVSDTALITSEGQSVSVQLSYAVDIFNGGAIAPFSTQEASSAKVEIGTEIVFSPVSNNPYNRGALAYTTNKVDLTDYNTIVFEGTFTQVVDSDGDKSRVGIMETAELNQKNWVASTILDTTNNSWTVDISSISGSYHICAFSGNGYTDWLIGSITRIYLA